MRSTGDGSVGALGLPVVRLGGPSPARCLQRPRRLCRGGGAVRCGAVLSDLVASACLGVLVAAWWRGWMRAARIRPSRPARSIMAVLVADLWGGGWRRGARIRPLSPACRRRSWRLPGVRRWWPARRRWSWRLLLIGPWRPAVGWRSLRLPLGRTNGARNNGVRSVRTPKRSPKRASV